MSQRQRQQHSWSESTGPRNVNDHVPETSAGLWRKLIGLKDTRITPTYRQLLEMRSSACAFATRSWSVLEMPFLLHL